MDWLDRLAVQGTLKSLLQLHSSEASILQHSAFSMVQLSRLYMTNGKTIALTRWTFVGKVMSLFFNMQSWLVIVFLSRNKHLLIPWLKSPWNSPGQNTGMDCFPGDLPNPGIEPRSPTLQMDSLPAEPQGKQATWNLIAHL